MAGRQGTHARAGGSAAGAPRSAAPGRSNGAKAALVAGGAVVALPVCAAVALVAVGVPILPSQAAPQAAAVPPPATVPVATITHTPAYAAVTDLLVQGPGPGWSSAGPITWAAGTPYDSACRPAGPPAASVAGQRTFTARSGGATAAAGGAGVTVQVRAYGAGGGALAFDRLQERLRTCPGRASSVDASTFNDTSSAASAGRDITGIAGTVRPEGSPSAISSLIWRRGDVVLTVLAARSDPSSLLPVARTLDAAAVARLRAVCPDLSSRVGDSVRSPWLDRTSYAGFLVSERVDVPPVGLPQAPAGIVPRPLGQPVPALPEVRLPERPADPVWPADLPIPVASPVVPTVPRSEPVAAQVQVQQRDDAGPGCGWAFAGQPVPQVDEATLIATREALLQQTRDQLLLSQQTWQQDVVSYWAAAAQYDVAAVAFGAYAAQVSQVAEAWGRIDDQRRQYESDVRAYQQAVADLARFQQDQARAQREYDTALLLCENGGEVAPTPTVTPSPTEVVPTGSPSPSPTDTVSPSPTATLAPGCPPLRPAILDQPAPTVPPVPVPPPDPRPAGAAPTR